MATSNHLSPREPRTVQLLRQAARAAEGVPVAGNAVRRVQHAENWALVELKQRLDSLSEPQQPAPQRERGNGKDKTPSEMMMKLMEESQGLDQSVAKQRLYRQVLSRMVPDQMAMFALLADREKAPLCHVAASRLPAGPISMVVLHNASSLGRDAGVLLRDYVPQYMSAMIQMGLMEVGGEDHSMDKDFEMLVAESMVRNTMDRIKEEMKMTPRLQKFSVSLSDFGRALWRDCQPD